MISHSMSKEQFDLLLSQSLKAISSSQKSIIISHANVRLDNFVGFVQGLLRVRQERGFKNIVLIVQNLLDVEYFYNRLAVLGC